MGIWHDLLFGFSVALQPENLLAAFLGALVGTVVGVLPGLGPAGAIAILLPITFGMNAPTALVMLAGIYYGSMYGGSITSILVRVPGEAASVVTSLDGYQMARQGRAGPALAIAALASWVAGTLGVLALTLVAPSLARFALAFGPPEQLCLAALALLTLPTVTGSSVAKAYGLAALGVLIATVGQDPTGGLVRFAPAAVPGLSRGIDFVPVVMGLYGVAEVLRTAEEWMGRSRTDKTDMMAVPRLSRLWPDRDDLRRSAGPTGRGAVIGFLVGLLPGPGNIVSTYISYVLERRLSKQPDEFGRGAVEGVAGPEAANNAATAGQLVPLLALGIPFSSITGLLLGGIMLHGIVPGPRLMSDHPELFWGLIASMYVGNVVLLVLNLPLVGLFARISLLRPNLLAPVVLVFCVIGAFSLNNSVFDVVVLMVAGVVGYLLHKAGYEPAPLVLGMIVGPLLEASLTQTGLILDGQWSAMLQRPLSAALLGLMLVAVLWPLSRWLLRLLLVREPAR
ncbi:tripartite tricarboxylate transporter permease [Rhodoplanes serenus]|uniref:Tripartite tricarboxylate transporter permease n=1 Tax=Rhodoplanes serenus TaxID=200615 RepID=A0A9X5AS69_9BRAD|nr:tripartite tricarboxylate transporter permease [Rhodoplanes serenus]